MSLTALLNILATVAVLALVFAIIYFVSRHENDDAANSNKARRASRDGGVGAALRALQRYASLHGFQYIQPAHLQSGGREADLDAILVTYSGVVGIRCLGYNGEVYATSGEPEWLWVTQESRVRIPDPVTQSAADVRVLRDALMKDIKLRNVAVECLPVFTDKKLQLSAPKSCPIYRPKELMAALNKGRYLEDKGIDAAGIAALLRAACGQ